MIDHAFRRKHIGASDIPTILGLVPATWGDIIDLWSLKIGETQPQEPNQYMITGIAREPAAREAYMQFTGNVVTDTENQVWEKHPFCSVSLDGVNMEGDLIVEIKCPTGTKTLELCKEGKIQPNYYAQIQWQLMISGAKLAHFWVWHPERGQHLMEITPNVDFQKLEFKAAQKFWEAVNSDFSPDPNYLVQDARELLSKVSIVASADREYVEIDSDATSRKKAGKYKQVSKEIAEMMAVVKELKVQQDQLKRELVDEGDGGDFIIEGLKFCAVQPKDVVDWAKAVTELQIEITPEQLKKYTKKRNPFYKVTVIGEGK